MALSGDTSAGYSTNDIRPGAFRLQAGDDDRWAQPHWDDHDWPLLESAGADTRFQSHDGPWWLRVPISFARPLPGGTATQVLHLTATQPVQVFWDGTLISRELRPDVFALPDERRLVELSLTESSLAGREHIAALRFPNPDHIAGIEPRFALHWGQLFLIDSTWRFKTDDDPRFAVSRWDDRD